MYSEKFPVVEVKEKKVVTSSKASQTFSGLGHHIRIREILEKEERKSGKSEMTWHVSGSMWQSHLAGAEQEQIV